VLLGVCMAAATSLWADKGHVTIKNCGSEKVWIGSYDWGDTVPKVPYESSDFAVGDQHTLHCVKNWFTQNFPGCQIRVKYGSSSGQDLGLWKVDNGTYTLGSVKTISGPGDCSTSVSACLKQQAACGSSATSNTTDCQFSGESLVAYTCGSQITD